MNKRYSFEILEGQINDLISNKNKLSRFQLSNVSKCFQGFNSMIIRYFFESQKNGFRPSDYYIPPHWNFHREHNYDLIKLNEKNRSYLQNMYNVSNINDVISQYYEFYESIRWFVEKSFVDIPGSKHLHMYIQLYTFLLLHSKFIEFVENSNDPNISYEGKEFINNLMQLCSLRLSNSFINRSYVEKKIVSI